MSDKAPVWRSGGGQPGYYMCSHGGCQKKARNIDTWGRSAELLSGDHPCCNHSKHSTDHIYRDRARAAREEAEAAGPPAGDPPGLASQLVRVIVRHLLGRRRR